MIIVLLKHLVKYQKSTPHTRKHFSARLFFDEGEHQKFRKELKERNKDNETETVEVVTAMASQKPMDQSLIAALQGSSFGKIFNELISTTVVTSYTLGNGDGHNEALMEHD